MTNHTLNISCVIKDTYVAGGSLSWNTNSVATFCCSVVTSAASGVVVGFLKTYHDAQQQSQLYRKNRCFK